MTVSLDKFRDVFDKFDGWIQQNDQSMKIYTSDNTSGAWQDVGKNIRDMAQKHIADTFDKMIQDHQKGTAYENATSLNKALDIFEIGEITKITNLKRHAQKYRNFFIQEISDAILMHKWENKVVIAGGCFTSWYHNEPLKDVDVFILDNTYIAAVLKEYVKQDEYRFKVGNSSYIPNSKIGYTAFDTTTRIQYIVSEYKTREELLDHFDLVHDCISYCDNKLYITRDAFDAMRTKTLKNNKGNKPADWRINKFLIDRGFRVG